MHCSSVLCIHSDHNKHLACTVLQRKSDSYAKRLTDKLQLLQADLPALSPNLIDDEVTLQTKIINFTY